MIPIYKPYIPQTSVEYVHDALRSSWISSLGKYVDEATERIANINNCKFVVLTNNGTSATHLLIKAVKRFNKDINRILVPSACYVAPYNSLLYDGDNFNVECVDLDLNTWNMSLNNIEENDIVYAVHNLGNIINVPEIKRKYGCTVIEDNCEGFFGGYEGMPSGCASLCSSLSFFANKNVTSGEGGAFLTNDKDVYDLCLKVRNQGQTSKRYIHDEVGYNYRMTNIQAALLLGQLDNIEFIYENKTRLFNRYRYNLKGVEGIRLQDKENNTKHSMWMFGVRFPNLNSYEVAKEFFYNVGIETRPMFYSFKEHGHLNFQGEDEIAKQINSSVVVFPSFPELTNEQIDIICDQIIYFSNTLK